MATTVARLSSNGVYFTNGVLDEVTYTTNKISSIAIYSAQFDEVTKPVIDYTNSGSLFFPTNSYLTLGTALTLGTTCTFECWFYATSDPASSKIVLIGSGGNRGISVYNGLYGQNTYSNTFWTFDFETAGNVTFTVPSMVANTWYHLALTQNAGIATLWLNGTRSSTGTITTNWSFISTNYRIGGWSTQSIYSQNVYISNARLTNTAVYDVTQTSITVPTSPLSAISNTQLLLNTVYGPLSSTDSSVNNITLTRTGSVSSSSLTPTSFGILAAKRETYDNQVLVSGYFDEVTGISSAIAPLAGLTFDLDAANYSAVPVNGTFDATGTYALTVANAGASISYSSSNGGYFSKSNNLGTDSIIAGPNYTSTSQSYSVFMAYDVNTTAGGRLLNTNNEATNDWLLGAYYNGIYYKNVWYPNASLNLTVDSYC